MKATRERFEAEEQVCFQGPPRLVAPRVEEQQRLLLDILETASADFRRAGIRASDPPQGWNYRTWRDEQSEQWLHLFDVAGEERRCELVELAYLFAVGQVTTLESTVPIRGIRDILIAAGDEKREDIVRDRGRAAWAFRYLYALRARDLPDACWSVFAEGLKRRAFLFTDRRPLGIAYGMCGHPMNSHYLDEEVSLRLRPEPPGWTGRPLR